jgi:hypothetical protein
MQQAKFSFTPTLWEFLCNYKMYGFKDRSSMVQSALFRLKEELELKNLKQSAELYAEIYQEDSELHEITETAIQEWPE